MYDGSMRARVPISALAATVVTVLGGLAPTRAHAQLLFWDFEDWETGCIGVDLCPSADLDVTTPSTLRLFEGDACFSGRCLETTWSVASASWVAPAYVYPDFTPAPREIYAEGTFRLAREDASQEALVDRELKLFVVYDALYASEAKLEILGGELVLRTFDLDAGGEELTPPATRPAISVSDLDALHRYAMHLVLHDSGEISGAIFVDDRTVTFSVPFFTDPAGAPSTFLDDVIVLGEAYWSAPEVATEVLYVDAVCLGSSPTARDECGALRAPPMPDGGVPPYDGGADRDGGAPVPRRDPIGAFRGAGGCACFVARPGHEGDPPADALAFGLVLVLSALRRARRRRP
jgi:hypothetical protein